MVLCLMELVKDINSTSEAYENDEEWTKKIDRGGLWYVTFQAFGL